MLPSKANRSRGAHNLDSTTNTNITNGSEIHSSTTNDINNEAVHVLHYMQSIDPSNHRILCSPPVAASTNNEPLSSLPFFPDASVFDLKPPRKSFVRINGGNNGKKQASPSVASVSSCFSSLSPSPSNRFYSSYSSNRWTTKTNATKLPSPRKTLFLSATRALTGWATDSNSSNTNTNTNTNTTTNTNTENTPENLHDSKTGVSFLTEISHNARSNVVVPFKPRNKAAPNTRAGVQQEHGCFDPGDVFGTTGTSSRHYRGAPQDLPGGGMFEADPPSIGTLRSSFLPRHPRSPRVVATRDNHHTGVVVSGAFTTPPRRIGLVATGRDDHAPAAPRSLPSARLANPVPAYAGFGFVSALGTSTTPKRVSLATGNVSPSSGSPCSGDYGAVFPAAATSVPDHGEENYVILPKSIFPPPTLRPHPSVGTTMAASALVAMMATVPPQPSSSSNNNNNKNNKKRPLAPKAICSPSSVKKRRMIPRRISNFHEEEGLSKPLAKRTIASRAREEEYEENSESLLYRTGNAPESHAFPKPRLWARRCQSNRSESGSRKVLLENHDPEASDDPSPSQAASNNPAPVRRIPRRFIDDSGLPVIKSGLRLSASNDHQALNSLHCYVRSELLEVFVLEDSKANSDANEETGSRQRGNGAGRPRKKEKKKTQHNYQQHHPQNKNGFGHRTQRVGIRCVHCGTRPKWERAGTSMSAFFPKSLQDIYRGVCTWQRIHFKVCRHIPEDKKELYWHLKDTDRSRGKKAHWVDSAHQMGFRNVDNHRNGVVWAGTAGPLGEEGKGSSEGSNNGNDDRGSLSVRTRCREVSLDLESFDDAVESGAYSDLAGDAEAI